MSLITRVADKSGAVGTIVSAMGCAGCFPALASLGAAIGLGFLNQYEGLLVSTLLPLFAGIALLANGLGWLSHRQWHRSVLGMLGPALVLVARYPLWRFDWHNGVLYTGLAIMLAASVWDIVSPANRVCETGQAGAPGVRNRSKC
ncbi:organomercurial transporter MerC [Paraburkholderia fungorum]|uniref:Mercuric ion transport protein n=1 Tax=Paraburkholderia fungorum TaxID=134537 RepID=A0AAW3V1N7_9BURK|nr:organomercurial transporter MerC [Paraburkholderia fungorum]MBB4517480.1 mercuric ion transport protein [Paraburkholderia fungorum]MBB6204548.1 mercuric ion transport protein [Paraburkholderia fungorum]